MKTILSLLFFYSNNFVCTAQSYTLNSYLEFLQKSNGSVHFLHQLLQCKSIVCLGFYSAKSAQAQCNKPVLKKNKIYWFILVLNSLLPPVFSIIFCIVFLQLSLETSVIFPVLSTHQTLVIFLSLPSFAAFDADTFFSLKLLQ